MRNTNWYTRFAKVTARFSGRPIVFAAGRRSHRCVGDRAGLTGLLQRYADGPSRTCELA